MINAVFKIVIDFYGLRMKMILLPCVRKNMDNFTRLFIGQFNSDHVSLSTTATSKNESVRVTFLSNLETLTLCRGDKMIHFIVTSMTLGLVQQFGDSFIKTINYANDNLYDLNGGVLHEAPTIKHFLNKNICCSFAMFVIFSQIGIAFYLSNVFEYVDIPNIGQQNERGQIDMKDDIVLKYLGKFSPYLLFIHKHLRLRAIATTTMEEKSTKEDLAVTNDGSLYILPDVIVHHRLGTLLMVCANCGYQFSCFRLVFDFYFDEQRQYLVTRSDGTTFKSAIDMAIAGAKEFFQEKIVKCNFKI